MLDFTLKIYQNLLEQFLEKNYDFYSFVNFIEHNYKSKQQQSSIINQQSSFDNRKSSIPNPQSSTINYKSSIPNPQSSIINYKSSMLILRHDVDRIPANALTLARLENELGIKGTYYFRVVKESYNPDIMEKIASLGHEIGYHYEDVDLSNKIKEKRQKNKEIDRDELIDWAYESFCNNLENLRKHFDIKTVCMHGSPLAKYDNKIIWEKYNYKDLGILGEPYYDVDFDKVAYFTDTGRRWNGHKVSVRDKVHSRFNFNYKSTHQIIQNIDALPDQVMFNFHPHRWFNPGFKWARELVLQNAKNVVKYFIAKRQK